jgi:hypothetical protein
MTATTITVKKGSEQFSGNNSRTYVLEETILLQLLQVTTHKFVSSDMTVGAAAQKGQEQRKSASIWRYGRRFAVKR